MEKVNVKVGLESNIYVILTKCIKALRDNGRLEDSVVLFDRVILIQSENVSTSYGKSIDIIKEYCNLI